MAKGIIESGRCENNAQHAAENGNQATRVVAQSPENPLKCGSAIRDSHLFIDGRTGAFGFEQRSGGVPPGREFRCSSEKSRGDQGAWRGDNGLGCEA